VLAVFAKCTFCEKTSGRTSFIRYLPCLWHVFSGLGGVLARRGGKTPISTLTLEMFRFQSLPYQGLSARPISRSIYRLPINFKRIECSPCITAQRGEQMFDDTFLEHASKELGVPRSHVIKYLLGGSTPLEWGRQRVVMVMYEDYLKARCLV